MINLRFFKGLLGLLLFFGRPVGAINFEEEQAQKTSTTLVVHFINEDRVLEGDVHVHAKAGRFIGQEVAFPLNDPHRFLTYSFQLDHFLGALITLRMEPSVNRKGTVECHLPTALARDFEIWVHLQRGNLFCLTESRGFSSS